MNRRLPDRTAPCRTLQGIPGRPLLARSAVGNRRALVVLFSFAVVVSPLVTGRATLPAAETVSNSSLFLAQRQPKKSPRNLLRGRTPGAESTSSAKSAEESEGEAPSKTGAGESSGFFRSLIRGIREQAIWIVIGLVCAIAGVLAWVLMGRASAGTTEEELMFADPAAAPAGGESRSRYSSTRIQAREVNDRLALDSTEVETDREYALVVDEDALKKPDVDERTGQVYADSSEITGLLGNRRFDEAYDTYTEQLGSAEVVEFHTEVEKSLSDHFLDSREFDKAARILEHQVATHAAADIDPDTYFNLGYIHFFNQKVKKSRRFLKLYVERESQPARVDRARRILEALDETSAG